MAMSSLLFRALPLCNDFRSSCIAWWRTPALPSRRTLKGGGSYSLSANASNLAAVTKDCPLSPPGKSLSLPSRHLLPFTKGVALFPRECRRGFKTHPVAGNVQALKDFSAIPGPRSFPFIGSTINVLMHKDFDPTNYYKFWGTMVNEYGNMVKVKILNMPTFVTTANPDDVEVILKATMQNPIRQGFDSLKRVRVSAKDNYFNSKSGLLPENGEEWWRLRSRVQVPLLRPRNVTMYLPAVDGATNIFMDRIDLLQAETGQVPEDFLKELYKWALECIGLVALNRELGCLDPHVAPDSVPMQLIRHINDVFAALNATEMGMQMWKFFRTSAYVQLEKSHAAFLELAAEAIKEAEMGLEAAKAKGDPDRRLTIMETFLNTEGLTRSDVATMVLDMLFAGVDTTSHTVGFALYLLSRNPEVQERLQQKVDAVVKRGEPLTPEHIAALDCIAHVVKETLRLYPLALGVARVLTDDIVMSGYRVPAGNVAVGVTAIMSRMEKYFPRPLEFLPERWQRDRPHGNIHPFASLPFSHGTRMCIGKRLAEQEIYTFLIRMLQKYTVSFESDQEMEVVTQLVLKPATPLTFKFHARH